MMDRMSSTVVFDEDIVATLPLCVRRLRGPGRARRLPSGSTYLSAGAALRRVLLYNENGQARVQVVRSDGLQTPKSGSVLHLATTPPAAVAAANALSATPDGQNSGGAVVGVAPGVGAESGEEGDHGESVTHISSQDAAQLRSQSQARRERAATLAAETERRYEEEQESSLSALLQALPLLRVVPPLSLQQQNYTRDGSATTTNNAASATATTATTTAAAAAVGSNALGAGSRPVHASERARGAQSGSGSGSAAVLRAAQARYGVKMLFGGSNATGSPQSDTDTAETDTESDAAANTFGRRERLGLNLRSAVLLSQEETSDRDGTAVASPAPLTADGRHRQEDSQEASEGATDAAASSVVPPSPSSAPSPPVPPSTLPPTAALAKEELFLAPSSSSGAAGAATLHNTFIDGGLGVTIKLGASCDEPNSLRCVAWGGCRPVLLRAVVWRLLSDYAPVQVSRQQAELQRKRRQYEGYTRQYCSALTMLATSEPTDTSPSRDAASPSLSISQVFHLPTGNSTSTRTTTTTVVASSHSGGGGTAATSLSRLPTVPHPGGLAMKSGLGGVASLAPHERAILHQMLLDLPRHQSPVFHARRSVAGMARCLFLWSQRHPAVGYVQGMDDVVAIFYQVFLTDALRQHAREQQQQQTREIGATPTPEGLVPDTSGSSERTTQAIVRLLIASIHPHRSNPPSAPITPNSRNAARTATYARAEEEESTCNSAGKATPDSASSLIPPSTPSSVPLPLFLTEADVDVYFSTPASLDAALADLPSSYLTQVEADTFACAGRVLSFLQDNFMSGQPGILRNVRRLEELVHAVDPAVVHFLDDYGLTVMDGCFQWLHCLLARELPVSLLLRLWDCYLAIGVGGERSLVGAGVSGGVVFASGGANHPHILTRNSGSSNNVGGPTGSSDEAIMYFHVCVCCALLRTLRTSLMGGVAAPPAPPPPLPSTSSAARGRANVAGGAGGGFGGGGGGAGAGAAAASSNVGGWAAALLTALPGFRGRGAPSTKDSGGASAGGVKPPIDVVMTTMKRPFEALFPNYPTTAMKQKRLEALLQRQRQGQQQQQNSSTWTSNVLPCLTLDPTAEEVSAEKWLDLLIADAYCIWRLHPLRS